MELSKLLKTQISLTEWFARIDHNRTDEIRKEDNSKRDRIAQIAEIIDFPREMRHTFAATDVRDRTPEFVAFLDEYADDLCALRLIPTIEGPPKLRMRGKTYRETVEEWLPTQNINYEDYKASFVQHPRENTWGMIFVVNQHGIFGEIVQASHELLTQGFYTDITPIQFFYTFDGEITLSEHNELALEEIKAFIDYLHVTDKEKRQKLTKEVGATFSHDYIEGYFETVTASDMGRHFIDYNRVLGELYADYSVITHDSSEEALLKGQTGSPGIVSGRVKIVQPDEIANITITKENILVCDMTSPLYVGLMKQAAGVITNRGGILTHAAIVSRELGIPCLVGTKEATNVLEDGMHIQLDATNGLVTNV